MSETNSSSSSADYQLNAPGMQTKSTSTGKKKVQKVQGVTIRPQRSEIARQHQSGRLYYDTKGVKRDFPLSKSFLAEKAKIVDPKERAEYGREFAEYLCLKIVDPEAAKKGWKGFRSEQVLPPTTYADVSKFTNLKLPFIFYNPQGFNNFSASQIAQIKDALVQHFTRWDRIAGVDETFSITDSRTVEDCLDLIVNYFQAGDIQSNANDLFKTLRARRRSATKAGSPSGNYARIIMREPVKRKSDESSLEDGPTNVSSKFRKMTVKSKSMPSSRSQNVILPAKDNDSAWLSIFKAEKQNDAEASDRALSDILYEDLADEQEKVLNLQTKLEAQGQTLKLVQDALSKRSDRSFNTEWAEQNKENKLLSDTLGAIQVVCYNNLMKNSVAFLSNSKLDVNAVNYKISDGTERSGTVFKCSGIKTCHSRESDLLCQCATCANQIAQSVVIKMCEKVLETTKSDKAKFCIGKLNSKAQPFIASNHATLTVSELVEGVTKTGNLEINSKIEVPITSPQRNRTEPERKFCKSTKRDSRKSIKARFCEAVREGQNVIDTSENIRTEILEFSKTADLRRFEVSRDNINNLVPYEIDAFRCSNSTSIKKSDSQKSVSFKLQTRRSNVLQQSNDSSSSSNSRTILRRTPGKSTTVRSAYLNWKRLTRGEKPEKENDSDDELIGFESEL